MHLASKSRAPPRRMLSSTIGQHTS